MASDCPYYSTVYCTLLTIRVWGGTYVDIRSSVILNVLCIQLYEPPITYCCALLRDI